MANEVVKYHNDLNTVPLRKFTATEMNLFFAIVSKARDKGGEKLKFTLKEIMDISGYSMRNYKELAKSLESTYTKILNLNYGTKVVTQRSMRITRFVLFPSFDIIFQYNDDREIDWAESTLAVQVHPNLYHILNELEQWTNYSLEEFVNLKSSYAKTAYRMLKQYRATGRYYVTIEDFRELFDIPKGYRVSNIDQKVLDPIKKELKIYFKDLKIKKIKSKKVGTPIIAYEFTFNPEKTGTFVDYSAEKQSDQKSRTSKNSREMTPKWLNEEQTSKPLTPEEQAEAEKLKEQIKNGFWRDEQEQTTLDDYTV